MATKTQGCARSKRLTEYQASGIIATNFGLVRRIVPNKNLPKCGAVNCRQSRHNNAMHTERKWRSVFFVNQDHSRQPGDCGRYAATRGNLD
jgi:hypothetical protein